MFYFVSFWVKKLGRNTLFPAQQQREYSQVCRGPLRGNSPPPHAPLPPPERLLAPWNEISASQFLDRKRGSQIKHGILRIVLEAMARRKKDPMKDLKEAQKLPANKKCADCTEKVSLREALLSLCIQRELPASCLFLTRALGCCRPRSRLFISC